MQTIDILNDIKESEEPNTNYRKWAFRLVIYVIIGNILEAYSVANYLDGFHDEVVFTRNLTTL
jgi:hypothetical protein